MKKYMKPIMESESFVANEYVGACYFVNCECTSDNLIKNVKDENAAYAALNGDLYFGGSGQVFLAGVKMGGQTSCPSAPDCGHHSKGYSKGELIGINILIGFINIFREPDIPRVTNDTKIPQQHHHITATKVTAAGKLSNGTVYGPNAS